MRKVFSFQIILLCLGLLLLSSCLQKNAQGRTVLLLENADALNQQAAAVYAEQIQEGKLSTDARTNRIVNRIAQRIIQQAELMYPNECAGFQWDVNVLESDAVNAYAMPGGKIAVYTGILKVCETEAALAAVMGHEVAHALLSHGNERMSQAKVAAASMAVAKVVTDNTDVVDEKYKQYVPAALGMVVQGGVLLPYSRAHESEADNMGLRISAAAGYDPKEAPRLWERMKAAGGGKAPMEILSTHPSNDRRIRDLTEQQAEVAVLYRQSPRYGLGEKF